MTTALTMPKKNWGYWPWTIGLWVFILYATYRWLLPVIGNSCSESINRLGLFFQIIGLASLVPEYMNLETDGFTEAKERLLIFTHIRWNALAEYQEFFNKTIFEGGRFGYMVIYKFVFCVTVIACWVLTVQGATVVSVDFDLFIPFVGFTCSVWLLLGASRFFLARMKKQLISWLSKLYDLIDGLLYITIFLPIALILGLVTFLVSSVLLSFELPLPLLIKKRTLPWIAAGTVLEFVATLPLSWCSF